MDKSKNIGLYFGSFNPVHIGHLIIAQHMVDSTELDQIWFVLSPQNPHKKKSNLLDEKHRLVLLRIATEDNYQMRVCDAELKLPKPSYTVHTLAFLNEQYPQHNFSIIMGGDNLRTFHKWKNYEIILARYKIYVYPRGRDFEVPKFEYGKIEIVNSPLIDISASLIREKIRNGENPKYLLSEKVYKYIDEMFFYKN